MAEESPRDTNSIGQISYRKFIVADGYDDYTESALARLAARFDSPGRIEQITRTSSPLKEPKGWRDQFLRMISTRKQRLITHGQERRSDAKKTKSRNHVKTECASKVVPEELIPSSAVSAFSLHFRNSCYRPGGYQVAPSINPVPNLKQLSPINEHSGAAIKRPGLVDIANRSPKRAKERPKQKKLTNGLGNNSRLQRPGSIDSSKTSADVLFSVDDGMHDVECRAGISRYQIKCVHGYLFFLQVPS